MFLLMSRIYGLRFKFLTTTIKFNYNIKSVAFSFCEASVNADALCCCMTIKGHKTGDFHITRFQCEVSTSSFKTILLFLYRHTNSFIFFVKN